MTVSTAAGLGLYIESLNLLLFEYKVCMKDQCFLEPGHFSEQWHCEYWHVPGVRLDSQVPVIRQQHHLTLDGDRLARCRKVTNRVIPTSKL